MMKSIVKRYAVTWLSASQTSIAQVAQSSLKHLQLNILIYSTKTLYIMAIELEIPLQQYMFIIVQQFVCQPSQRHAQVRTPLMLMQ